MHIGPTHALAIDAFQGYGFKMRFAGEHGAIGGTGLTGLGPAMMGLIALSPHQREGMFVPLLHGGVDLHNIKI